MNNKTEIIQVRVPKILKESFFKFASEQGTTPTELLRSYIEELLELRTPPNQRIAQIEEDLNIQNEIQKELLKFLIKTSLNVKDTRMFELLKKSNITHYFKDTIMYQNRNGNLSDAIKFETEQLLESDRIDNVSLYAPESLEPWRRKK